MQRVAFFSFFLSLLKNLNTDGGYHKINRQRKKQNYLTMLSHEITIKKTVLYLHIVNSRLICKKKVANKTGLSRVFFSIE